jgi:hypothetical protein
MKEEREKKPFRECVREYRDQMRSIFLPAPEGGALVSRRGHQVSG